jgi:hypothetical protein
MTDTIRRRSLPDSLRWLADKLDSGTLTDAETAGVALTLHSLAEEVVSVNRCVSVGGHDRRCELGSGHGGLHENNEFFGLKWANHPGDPADAGPVRPGEETTT